MEVCARMARWTGRYIGILVLLSICAWTDGVVVTTKAGSIQGTTEPLIVKETANGPNLKHNLIIYRGIPYGNVSKRFSAPEPTGLFGETFQANEFGSSCLNALDLMGTLHRPITTDPKASNLTQSEDCLFLNIYVPTNPSNGTPLTNLSVIVFIHGGYFIYGSGSDFDGRYLAATQTVIVVTFNYRLNVFGFLSTGTAAASGNYGLLDQVLALQWVNKNIEKFGGNRDSVTLLGHGAGATSAGYHTLSPLSKGLFKRVIMASGSAVSSVPSFNILDNDNGVLLFKEFARNLGCQGDDIYFVDLEKVVECIRRAQAGPLPPDGVLGTFSKTANSFSYILDSWARFGPVVDGHFLPAHPSLLLSRNLSAFTNLSTVAFPDVDIMFGLNSNEGGKYFSDVKTFLNLMTGASPPDYGIPHNKIDSILNLAFPYTRFGKDVLEKLKDAVRKEYFVSTNTDVQNRDAVFDMLSDRSFTSGTVANAVAHAKAATTSKTFLYVFDGKPSLLEGYQWNERGAYHGDDLPFILGTTLVDTDNNTYPESGRPITDMHRQLSLAMMKHLAKFAKMGNPTDQSDAVQWDPFTVENEKYTKISTEMNSTERSTTVGTNFRQSKVDFWTKDVVKSVVDGSRPYLIASLPPNQAKVLVSKYAFQNVRGLTEDFHDKKVHVFRGIRYAKKPVKRFGAPTASRAYYIHDEDAYEFGAACLQYNRTSITDLTSDPKIHNQMDEDCHFLNIYVPYNTTTTLTKAVMVYIHGGGFMSGSGASIDGRPLAVDGDVIVVTLNYRLGVFGFLSTGDEAARGNWGLLDQHAALQWVKTLISFFGGDKSRITLFGSDAGGVSASLHAMSPLSIGLFQRVISQSGAAIDSGAPWRISNQEQQKPFLDLLKGMQKQCAFNNSTAMIECLRSVSATKLNAYNLFAQSLQLVFRYGSILSPVVDGHFLPSHPLEGSTKFQYVDYMLGFNSNEGTAEFDGLQMLFQAQRFKPPYPLPEDYYNDMVAGFSLKMSNKNQVIHALKAKYPLEPTDGLVTRNNVMKMYGDSLFVAPSFKDALRHYANMLEPSGNSSNVTSSKRKTYVYEFDISPSLLVTTPWSTGYGAGHGDEVPYVFGMPLYSKEILNKDGRSVRTLDETMSKAMMALWTNFAKTGDPTVEALQHVESWTPFTEKDRDILVISTTKSATADLQAKVKKNIRWEDAYFWNEYIPYVKDQYCTEPTPPAESTPVQTMKAVEETTSSILTTSESMHTSTTAVEELTPRPTPSSTELPTTTTSESRSTTAQKTSRPILTPSPDAVTIHVSTSVPSTTFPRVTKLPTCPPIENQKLGSLAIDVKTGETMIIILAVVVCFFFATSLVLLALYCNTRNTLSPVPNGHSNYDNPSFTEF